MLDEPSIGLHTRDTVRLIKILKELRELGNTIIVVEHDPEVMRAADHIVDMGPGAGELGGNVIFSGSSESLAKSTTSLTSKYLRGELDVATQREPRTIKKERMLGFYGARLHNLKGVDVEIPLAAWWSSPVSPGREKALWCTTSSTRARRKPRSAC